MIFEKYPSPHSHKSTSMWKPPLTSHSDGFLCRKASKKNIIIWNILYLLYVIQQQQQNIYNKYNRTIWGFSYKIGFFIYFIMSWTWSLQPLPPDLFHNVPHFILFTVHPCLYPLTPRPNEFEKPYRLKAFSTSIRSFCWTRIRKKVAFYIFLWALVFNFFCCCYFLAASKE